MDKSRLTVWIAAVGSLLGAVALHGKSVLDVLGSIPAALQAWTQGTAAGVLTFVGALVLSTLLWIKERRAVQECGSRLYLSPDWLAIIAAWAACMGSQWFVAGDAGSLFRAWFVGSIAGLLAPLLGRLLLRAFTKKVKPLPPPVEQ